MSIGLITNFPFNTGLGRYAFELFNHLNKKTDIKLVYCNGNDDFGNLKIDGINFPVLKKTLNAFFVYPPKIPDFDLYHATNQFLSRVVKFKRPCIVTALDLFFVKSRKNSPFLGRFLMKHALKHLHSADRIITISNSAKKTLIEYLGLDENKIDVTYLGVDLKKFRQYDKINSRKKLKLPLDKKIIFNIGSESDYRKNAITVIKSFYEAQKLNKDLFLVKEGKLDKKIDNLIKNLNIEKGVIRLGVAKSELLPLYYSAADLYVNLDLETGFNLPVLESAACGTPTICSSNDQASEIIKNNCLLTDPLNIQEIKLNILTILKDDDLREKLIKKGKIMTKKYTWEKTANETLKIYKKVV